MNLIYILTGQKQKFWKIYFNNMHLSYKYRSLMLKRGKLLFNYNRKQYGLLIAIILLIGHYRTKNLRVPFRYYKSVEIFVIRNILLTICIAFIAYNGIISFEIIKSWIVNVNPSTIDVIYPYNYYPYSIFIGCGLISIIQMGLMLISKTIREVFAKYKYEIITLNFINVFILITVFCTVAQEGAINVWWIPENYEMSEFFDEQVHTEKFIKDVKVYYKELMLEPVIVTLKYKVMEIALVTYKVLRFI